MSVSEIIPDTEYRIILKHMPIATVDIVLFDYSKEKTLLFRRLNAPAKDLYYTCGGRLFKNEMLIDAAIRKGRQELGIELKKSYLRFAGVIDEMFPDSSQDGISTHCVNTFYAYLLDHNATLALDDQHANSKWFLVTDTSLHPYIQQKIKQALGVL